MSLPGMTPFLEACGATGPFEVGIASARHPEPIYYVLHQPFAVIGRDPRNDLMLHDEQISKRHAFLQILDGRAFCFDLGSRSGVEWDGLPGQAGWIDPQQCIGVGPFQVCVTGGCSREPWDNALAYSPLSSQETEPPGLPEVMLAFANGAADKDVWPMTSRIALIGRSPQCKVCLEGPSVSRFHCALIRTPHGLWVADLLGRGGIAVNGQHTRYTLLREGDRLQVGRFVVQIVTATKHTAPAAEQAPVAEPADGGVAPGIEENSNHPLDPSADTANYPPPTVRSDPAVKDLEIPESAYLPLLNQFALMQQQMFDQFQHAMLGMMQMFGALHRDQMEALQAELDDLRSVTRELQGLQTQLSALPPAANGTAVVVPPAATSIDATLDLSLANLEQMDHASGNGAPLGFAPDSCSSEEREIRAPDPDPQQAQPARVPEEPLPSWEVAEELTPDQFDCEEAAPSALEDPPDPCVDPELVRAAETEETDLPNPPPIHADPPPGSGSPEEIHALLCKRMATLQEEQQSRWRRILGILTRAGK
jgi:pSer/pThr/pTyr-binding forkhead associated (FHA) protein